MQKEIVFYYISIILVSVAIKEAYRGMRNDFLYPQKLMKTLIYKSSVRFMYIFVYIVIILLGAVYISYLPKILTADFEEIHGKIEKKEVIVQNQYILYDMTLESGENIIAYLDRESADGIEDKNVDICNVDFKYLGNFVKKIDGKYTDFYLKYYKHNIINKILLCIYLIANYLIQTWKVKGIEDKKKNTDKKKRLSIELGIYSAVLLYLCISGKGNTIFNISVVLLFVIYNLENMFYIMPEKAEMLKTKETNTTRYVKNKELKPLKRMDAEKYKKEYLKKTRKSNRAYLLVYTGIVYAVILLILITVPKEKFIAGILFYIPCYFIGLLALLIRNRHKTRMAKEKKFENVYYGEGKIINTNEIAYLNEQEEYKTINAPVEMNKKNEIGDNVKIIIADDHLME